jgi:hypothetical protein
MAKFKAEAHDTEYAQKLLQVVHGLRHLRTRGRADTVTIESGPEDDPVTHARVRRVGVHLWVLEIADHRGRWEPTDVRAKLDIALTVLAKDFGWVLTPIDDDENPLRTSDRED